MPTPLETLQRVFGYSEFRPGQAQVVEAQLAGRDVLSVAPTGSGKSISYWVPAVAAGGLTVVVSPLIALMKDQVDRLRSLGVAAGFINSTLPRDLQVRQLEEAEEGWLQLLYVAPERFSRPGFLDRLGRLRVGRLVVDEAHCISSWGHDFRPDYRLLHRAVHACGRPPIAAFTATATPPVREDIVSSLEMRSPLVVVTGFHRPNLELSAQRCRGEGGKREALLRILDPGQGRALVYTGTRAASEELADVIGRRGLPAAAYHAGLSDDQRREVQEAFAGGRLRVVVATTAFGMGIDLPDIRQVIHHHLPGSLEAYYQEAGRAGRDGRRAQCVLLWSPADRDLHVYFLERGDPPPPPAVREGGYARLAQIMAYARLRTCRHARIADYFGEAGVERTCPACDNCLGGHPPEVAVGAAEIRTALAGAARFSGRIGAANLAAVLAGRESAWTRRNLWVSELPQFGSLAWQPERVRELVTEMTEVGLLRQSAGEYPVLEITRMGREVLLGRSQVEVTLPQQTAAPSARPLRSGAVNGDGALTGADAARLERLRRWRLEVSRREGVPAYVVFHDRTLAALAAASPRTAGDLALIPGVGPSKLERYGAALLALLNGAGEAAGQTAPDAPGDAARAAPGQAGPRDRSPPVR
jgi:ATP-dependent DNA helicase RecQ